MKRLSKELAGPASGFAQLRRESLADGALSRKSKELIALGAAIAARCFVIFALITFSMTGTFAASFPGLPPAAHLLIGLGASLLFFGSVLFHEMAHSLMAIRSGKLVRSITLFIFGGVSEIGKESDRPGEEIRIRVELQFVIDRLVDAVHLFQAGVPRPVNHEAEDICVGRLGEDSQDDSLARKFRRKLLAQTITQLLCARSRACAGQW